MRTLSKKLPSDFNLFLYGDLHIGSVLHHDDGLDNLIDMLNSPYGGLPAKRNLQLITAIR